MNLLRATCLKLINPKSGALLVISIVIMIYTIQKFTIHHPFLLADNRHITFYIWKDIYRRHPLVPQLMVPAYMSVGWFWYKKLQQQPVDHQSLIFWLGYFIAVAIILIPSPLLEFRYFIIPFIILRLHLPFYSYKNSNKLNWLKLVLEIVLYLVLHTMITSLFLFKPFIWLSEPTNWQRFMW